MPWREGTISKSLAFFPCQKEEGGEGRGEVGGKLRFTVSACDC